MLACVTLVVPTHDVAIAYYTQVPDFDLIEDSSLLKDQRWVLVAPPGSRETRILLTQAKGDAQTQRIGD